MEASETVTPPEAPDANGTPDPEAVAAARAETSPAEARHPQELFRFSEWVHVGPGAEECEQGEDGSCTNELHFHAWCRLPNQFQHQSIRDKALAAKARRVRQYRDAESDASAILDSQLEEVEYAMGADAARNTYVEEVVYRDYMKDYFEVVQEMADEEPEEEGEPSKWATIDEDKNRLAHLKTLDPGDRPEDEYSELESHVSAYNEEIEKRVKERQESVRQSLADRSLDDLRSMVREQRVQKDANQVYMQTYTLWEQYIGTMKTQTPMKVEAENHRVFKDVNHLKAAAPEVVQALDTVFTNLDGEFGKTLTAGITGKD